MNKSTMDKCTRIACGIGFLTLCSACYTSQEYNRSESYINSAEIVSANQRGSEQRRGWRYPQERQVAQTPQNNINKPWEAFNIGYDLYGRRLQNRYLQMGDEYLGQGLKGQALSEYQKASGAALLTPAEKEVLALRMSSAELSQDRPKESLAILGRYFNEQGQGVDSVKPPFAIVFGYAYGRAGDIEQALAWLSRAYLTAGSNGKVADSARMGVDLLLRSVPDEKLYAMQTRWLSDTFISSAIGRENSRRASTLTPQDNSGGIGLKPNEVQVAGMSGDMQLDQQTNSVAVMLPLSGPYAALGASARNGASLVLDGRSDGLKVRYLDTKGDANQTTMHLREMITRNEHPVVIGPLLATPAASASVVAKQGNIPLIVLSKRSDFVTSSGIFRLGTTTESQVSSLLERAYGTLGLVRYALVYPANENGTEYAKVFKNIARQMRLEIVYEASYHNADGPTFETIGKALEDTGVEGVFMPTDIEAAVTFMQSLSEDLRSRIRMLGTPSWDDLNKLVRAGQLMERAVFVTPFFMQSSNQLVQNFIATYQQRYGRKPDFMAAQGFDVATLAVSAIERQKQTGEDFVRSLQTIRYDGVTGSITAQENGELYRKLAVVQYLNGNISLLDGQSRSPIFIAR